eukprot:SAG22_NODE_400_length_11089_cov_6.934668_2_plen_122_part_00
MCLLTSSPLRVHNCAQQKPDFAWIAPEKIKHYETARQACLPTRKEKKYKSVMAALAIADKIHTDPRDVTPAQAQRILAELDKVFASHADFALRTTARLERLVAGPQDATVARAVLPIWARD